LPVRVFTLRSFFPCFSDPCSPALSVDTIRMAIFRPTTCGANPPKIHSPFAPPHHPNLFQPPAVAPSSLRRAHKHIRPRDRVTHHIHSLTRASTILMAVTACRIAAPLGVSPLPGGRAGAFSVQCGENENIGLIPPVSSL
jgi:hypothetical protein